jgi:hypothetical protein
LAWLSVIAVKGEIIRHAAASALETGPLDRTRLDIVQKGKTRSP